MAREEREHYYFMSHSQYPRWCNKMWRIKGMFWTIFISVAFFAWTTESVNYFTFSASSETSLQRWVGRGTVSLFQVQATQVPVQWKKRKWDIHSYPAIQHCSVLSFVLLVFLTHTQKRATDMQRNHAGMNFGINYLWLGETIPKALNPKCGGTKNWKFKALSIDRFSSGTETFRNHKLARWREWRRQMSLLCGRGLIEGFSRWASAWQNMKLIR